MNTKKKLSFINILFLIVLALSALEIIYTIIDVKGYFFEYIVKDPINFIAYLIIPALSCFYLFFEKKQCGVL